MKNHCVYEIYNYNENGIYIGYTSNFEVRAKQHLINIKKGVNLNKKFLKSVKKNNPKDFKIRRIACFNSEIEALVAEAKLIEETVNNSKILLYNKKTYKNTSESITVTMESSIWNRLETYLKNNEFNFHELARKILKYYFNKSRQLITWNIEQIRKDKKSKTVILNISNKFVRIIHDYFLNHKVFKSCIVHSATELYFNEILVI